METDLTAESRISNNEYFLAMAVGAAMRGTCARRKVGCVLTDVRGHVLSTGYNGVASGVEHCSEKPCPGASYPSGQGLEHCRAIHAEENAMIQCRHPFEVHTAYVTASPCRSCTYKLLNTSCQRIVFIDEYPHSESKEIWTSTRGEWIRFDIDQFIYRPPGYDRLIWRTQ